MLGLRSLRTALRGRYELGEPLPGGAREEVVPERCFLEGLLSNVLNPKTALFFLAFLPQFIDPHAHVAPQIVVLGLTFVALGLVTDSTWALVAGASDGVGAAYARGLSAQTAQRALECNSARCLRTWAHMHGVMVSEITIENRMAIDSVTANS